MNKNPKVSVLTPIYNTNPDYLREMIESILTQTYKDFEFIILNDSPENTEIEDIVLSYQKKDNRIKYHKNEKNMGISASRNKLLDMSKGEYIAIFDHDDISMPTRLEKQVKFLDENPLYGVVSSNVDFFLQKRIQKHPKTNVSIKWKLMRYNVVQHTAMMIRKSVLDKTGIRYEEAFSPAEDYRLVLKLLPHTMFYNIQEPLVKYRDFGGNTSHNSFEKHQNAHIMCHLDMAKDYMGFIIWPFINSFERRYKKMRNMLTIFMVISFVFYITALIILLKK